MSKTSGGRSTDRPLQAFGWMLGSALAFALMSLFVRGLGGEIPSFELVFFRSLSNLLLAACWIRLGGGNFGVPASHRRFLLLRGVAGFAGIGCLYYSLSHLSMAVASILAWSSPLFVILFSRLIWKETMPVRAIVCIAASFLGLIVLLRPFGQAPDKALSWVAVGIGLAGAASAGFAYLMVRTVTARVRPEVVVFYFMCVATVLSLPLAVADFVPPASTQWGAIAALCVTAFLGQILMTRGYQFAPAGKVSAMSLMTTVFSAAIGWLYFGEDLSLSQLLGMGIVILSLATLTWSSRTPEQGASSS
jgi:drug/metabolite transporter (DMT)-like permease